MLKVANLEAYYGGHRALKEITLEVSRGEIVCLIGANGAGKTTLLNCLSGLHRQRRGTILFDDQDITGADARKMVKLGVVQVPENRQLFGPLTVEENLEMGAYLRAARMKKRQLVSELERIYDLFPALMQRRKQRAATLSGGEQQMVAIGRGLMADPKLMLLDEPSLGLAPLLVREIFHIVEELRNQGRTVLLVEQNAIGALTISDRAYVIENGRMSASGSADALLQNENVRRAFLGQDVMT